jgi:type II secretory pathway component PulF
MPKYTYKAVDAKGRIIKGTIEAASEMEVSTQLAKIGYLPISIGFKEEAVKPFVSDFLKKSKKVSPQSLIIFSRQFATIIKAAVPIVEGLGVLADQSEDPVLKYTLHQIVHDVEGGVSLSAAMAKHPSAFSDLYVNTVIAGEAAGVLDKVLLRLARMLEDDEVTRSNVQAALRYPIMVVIALVVAVVVLSVFVIPQFAKIYGDMKVALPIPTRILISLSNVLRFRWYLVVPSVLGGFFLFRWLINTKAGRYWFDGLKFKMVIMGKIYTKITMLRFSSMLSVLHQSGLPVLKTMDIVGLTIGNAVLSKEIAAIKYDVADGKGISGAVLNSKYFPKLVGYMISVGEKSGALPEMLDSICEYYDLEVKTAVKNLTTLIEPLMTAVLGVVVMGMALAIFLPIWSLLQVVKGS